MSKFPRRICKPCGPVQATTRIKAYEKKFKGQTKSCTVGADDVARWNEHFKENPKQTALTAKFALNPDDTIDLIFYPVYENGNLGSFSHDNTETLEGGGATGDNATSQCPPFCNCPPDDPNCNGPS